jgi:hypothetical protein
MAHPLVLVASDGIPFVDYASGRPDGANGQAHPRGAGTFCRFLGVWCREKQLLAWPEAIRKMTLGPAKRLEDFVPSMRTKGRLGAGMDADITVFDPLTVIDRATLTQPAQPSAGVAFVVVNGALVVDRGAFQRGVLPGRAVRGHAVRGAGARAPKQQKTTALFSTLLEGQVSLSPSHFSPLPLRPLVAVLGKMIVHRRFAGESVPAESALSRAPRVRPRTSSRASTAEPRRGRGALLLLAEGLCIVWAGYGKVRLDVLIGPLRALTSGETYTRRRMQYE